MDLKTAVFYLAMGYAVLLNLVTFLVFGLDKLFAIKQKWRVPEATLLTLSACGGALGGWLAMLLFRHKTLHKSFKLGVPCAGLCWIAVLTVYFILIF